MAIYRGIGGAGDSTTDATVTAVTEKATEAASSASSAATSASNASTSASNASTSATNASNSASNASTSETNASNSASAASTSASNASTSETNAAASASAASTSETNAAASESAASTSETNAASSASNASTSASTATTQASNAATSASNASTSATNASNSASAASTSETNASNSASAASTSASNAAASYDSFDDRYLGAKASDPTLDNDGDALLAGALYFNTTDDVMKVYEGSVWVAAYASLSGTLVAANNLSDLTNAATARTNLSLGTAATTASTDYATAAQGALADSAVQPADNVSTLTNDSGYLTGNQTITLSGDASGSGTTAITVTVADDSHNHVISNVDGLQTALDAKGTLSNVVEDTTPQLGGNLDLNSNDITGTGSLNAVADSDYGASITATSNSSAANWARIDLINQNASAGALLLQDQAGTFGIRNLNDGSPIFFETNNGGASAERMRIDSTGNVGIGTSSPSTALDVNGTVTVDGLTTSGDINFGDSDKANFGVGSDLQIYHDGSNSYIDDAGTGALVIRSNEIQVQKYTGETLASFIADGTAQLRYDNGLKLATTATGVTVTGAVTSTTGAVGSTAGDEKDFALFECGSSDVRLRDIRHTDGATWTTTETRLHYSVDDNASKQMWLSFYNPSGDTIDNVIRFGEGDSNEWVRIDNGNVGIGTSSPSQPLHVVGGAVRFENTQDTYFQINTGDTHLYTAGLHPLRFGTNSTERMRIASNGNVGIGDSAPDVALDVVGSIYYTGTISDVSDRRLKENVLDLSDSLNKVCQLNAKSYTLIADRDNEEEEVELGFIAQEVQTVFPEVVKNIQKYVVDENGEDTEEEINYLGVSYIQLVAPMVEAIKELKTEVDILKAKVTALEAANGS
jgi:hypothetical protein